MDTWSLRNLPYHVILLITRDFLYVVYNGTEEENQVQNPTKGVLEYYGRFFMDHTRKVFQIFHNFDIRSLPPLLPGLSLPLRMKGLSLSWGTYEKHTLLFHKLFLRTASSIQEIHLQNVTDESEGAIRKGIIYHYAGNYTRAIESYNRALVLDYHDLTDVFINRGISQRIMKKYEEAIESFSRALDIDSAEFSALFNRAFSHFLNGNHKEAIEDYSRTIRMNRFHYESFNNRGHCYELLGDLEEAVENYNVVISARANTTTLEDSEKLYKTKQLSGSNRCICYYRQGLREKAQIDLDSLDRGFFAYWRAKAFILKEEGKFEQAVECFGNIALRENAEMQVILKEEVEKMQREILEKKKASL